MTYSVMQTSAGYIVFDSDTGEVASNAVWPTKAAAELAIALGHARPGPQPCQHEWHYYGTVNGEPDYGCQLCGATRAWCDRGGESAVR